MYDTPVQHHRPTRTSDSVGGSTISKNTAPQTLWVDPISDDNGMSIAFHPEEDVRIGDLIIAPYNLFQSTGGE